MNTMEPVIFGNYDRNALDAQFRLDGIADLALVFERRAKAAADASRLFTCRPGLRYAAGEDRTLDFYPSGGQTPGPLLVFFHGGFWRSLEAALFSFLASGFVPRGASVAVVDYPLMPRVSLEELVTACAASLEWLHHEAGALGFDPDRLFIAGNSAGGHIVAEMLSGEHAPAKGIVAGGCAVSGLFDLAPVRLSSQNDTLALTMDEVRRFSPLLRTPKPTAPLIVAVGADEAPEFLRQSADYAEMWRRSGGEVEHLVVPDTNHVTVVLDGLADPATQLNALMRRQMGLAATS